jgi:hypothetical protein
LTSLLHRIAFALAVAACAAAPLAAQSSESPKAPASCPVTRPPRPAFVPPPPYNVDKLGSGFWYGSDKLWIALPADGVWELGHYTPTTPEFRQKMLWFRKGFNAHQERRAPLVITGMRIDSSASPLKVDGPSSSWQSPERHFMVVGLNIPTTDCWKITGRYGEHELSFVVWITGKPVSSPAGD